MLLNTAVPIQPNISMQSLRVSTRWMHCLRNVGRPTLRAYRSWQTTSVAPGSLCRHCGAKQRKAYEAREPPHYGLCCTSRSYAISVSPTHSYEVDVMVEGRNQVLDRHATDQLAGLVRQDGSDLMQQALKQGVLDPAQCCSVELSVVLCGDAYITELNQEWRGKAAATDVLSFPAADWDDLIPDTPLALGDVVISLDTAHRQATEQGHSLQDECRILLLHGLLHLLGHDHELGEEESDLMAQQEQDLLQGLAWKGVGLIGSTEERAHEQEQQGSSASAETYLRMGLTGTGEDASISSSSSSSSSTSTYSKRARWSSDIRLLALDMDGTLLDSNSKVLPSSVRAIQAALKAGVLVCLATGKARPAALSALTPVGLAGPGLVVSQQGPGIFLQGLDTYNKDGLRLPSVYLEPSIVKAAFEYSARENVTLSAFLGDDCVTMKHTPEIQELKDVYYEPLAKVLPSVDDILAGPPVLKLLFMTDPKIVDSKLKPDWQRFVREYSAETMQAVPNMLELVPKGVNKGSGMRKLLANLELPVEAVMAIGDGGNDLPLLQSAGLGIAMGNAVPEVSFITLV
ncbi:hypothetical protein ABBQ32_004294 [Trebouxia sp. C0010 RCD-2024]